MVTVLSEYMDNEVHPHEAYSGGLVPVRSADPDELFLFLTISNHDGR